MVSRFAALILLLALASCQSAGSSSDATGVAALESVDAGDDAAAETAAAEPVAEPDPETETGTVAAVAESTRPAVETAKVLPPDDDVLRNAVVDIAKLHKAKGHQAALARVSDCYTRAQSKDVTMEQSKICAVQDFAISRATENRFKAQGKSNARNRTLIVAKRAPERIGALMQLKGMTQSQLNSFALYLHAVVLPTFEKTRT